LKAKGGRLRIHAKSNVGLVENKKEKGDHIVANQKSGLCFRR